MKAFRVMPGGRLSSKLESESGASVLLALGVMLVCTMVASVVLVAASANAGKVGGTEARNRAYLSATCAAQMLADDFVSEAPSAEVSTSSRSYACQDAHPTYVHEDANVVSEREVLAVSRYAFASPFMITLDNAIREIDPLDSSSSFESQLVLHAPGMDDVRADVKMDFEYNISVEIQSMSDSGYSYALTLSIPAVNGEPVPTTTVERTDGHLDAWEYNEQSQGLSWKETTALNPSTGNYEPESNEFGQATMQLYDVTTTTNTRFVTWGDPVLSKGVAR